MRQLEVDHVPALMSRKVASAVIRLQHTTVEELLYTGLQLLRKNVPEVWADKPLAAGI